MGRDSTGSVTLRPHLWQEDGYEDARIDVATPREQWADQEQRGANFAREGWVGLGIAQLVGLQRPALLAAALDAHAELLEQADLGADIFEG